jgi:hypothetical protein
LSIKQTFHGSNAHFTCQYSVEISVILLFADGLE